MPSTSVNSLLINYPEDKLQQTRKYQRYSTILDRMFYEMTYFNYYYLLGVTPIEGTTEINMELLRETVQKAVNYFSNSKIPNILSKINYEYRMLRKIIIRVNFDIDDDIQVTNWDYLKDLFNFITCSCYFHDEDDIRDDGLSQKPLELIPVKTVGVYTQK